MRSLFTLLATLLLILQSTIAQKPVEERIRHNLDLLDSIYHKLAAHYFEEIDPDQFTRKAIDELLYSIDPFTYYMSKPEAEEFGRSINARFGGTGLAMSESNGRIIVRSVFEGFPANRAGIEAGDIIVQIDSTSLAGISLDNVFPLLMGEPGSVVKLKIEKYRNGSIAETTITRELIRLKSVPFYGVLENQVGYIRLNQMSKDCHQEVKDALNNLKRNGSLRALILDLRLNSGGLLNEAVKTANLFLPRGTKLLSQKGRTIDSVHYASDEPFDIKIPLVILTGEGTASSAEILSGALQDNDRAVVMGEPSFGKGYVGVIYGLGEGREAIITRALYYTPSGRCIHAKRDLKGKKINVPDSLKKIFYTSGGRPVRQAGGISPDVFIKEPVVNVNVQKLKQDNYFFKYALQFRKNNQVLNKPDKFSLNEGEIRKFITWAEANGFTPAIENETQLEILKVAAVNGGYWNNVKPHHDAILAVSRKNASLSMFVNEIKSELEEEIMRQSHYEAGAVKLQLRTDQAVRQAIQFFLKPGAYEKLLRL